MMSYLALIWTLEKKQRHKYLQDAWKVHFHVFLQWTRPHNCYWVGGWVVRLGYSPANLRLSWEQPSDVVKMLDHQIPTTPYFVKYTWHRDDACPPLSMTVLAMILPLQAMFAKYKCQFKAGSLWWLSRLNIGIVHVCDMAWVRKS